MTRTAALPFTLRRSSDVFGAEEITSTKETVHGLLLLEPDRLVIQWRVARRIERIGMEIRADQEMEPVQEVVIPLRGLASATLRSPWWSFGRAFRLVLTAADLRTFEDVVGREGFELSHPAELVLAIRPVDGSAARAFAGELEMTLADRALRRAEEGTATRLPPNEDDESP